LFNPHANWLGGVKMAEIMVWPGVRMVRDTHAENRKVRDVGRIQLNPTNAMKTLNYIHTTQADGKREIKTPVVANLVRTFTLAAGTKGQVEAALLTYQLDGKQVSAVVPTRELNLN
jgi:hypothetical protein